MNVQKETMKKKFIIYAFLVLGIGALVTYRLVTPASPVQERRGAGKKSSVILVDAVVVKPAPFSDALSVTGALEAQQEVKVISQTAGLVTRIYFKEGSNVKQGQVLLEIDATEQKAKQAEAMTNEALARETERRSSLLIKSGAISQQEYDAASASLKAMRAQTQLVNAQLAKSSVRAPFSGRIGLTTVTVGSYLAPTDVIANLVSLNPIKVSFSIPEKYASVVPINTSIQFKVASSSRSYTAKVFALEPAIQQNTRTLQLKASTPNPDGTLLPGSFARISLPIATIENAILVPSEAIVPIQNGQKLFVAENGRAREVLVEGSTRTDRDILITSGLKAGDTVITSGNMSLKKGDQVKVKISNRPSSNSTK